MNRKNKKKALMKLPETHSSMYHEFQHGNIFVRRIPEIFNKMPSDEVTEQTINEDQ